jgi:Na+-driven multidrug efflux pump
MGEEALSAIGISGPLDYVLNVVCALFGIGSGVVISRRW